MIRRPPRSTPLYSSAASDVYKRQHQDPGRFGSRYHRWMPEFLVDLFSDTLTKPSPAMRQAMVEAEVGDEQKFEDPTTNRLQEMVAGLLGQEAAVFLPSGTMCNEIAFAVHCGAGDEIILDQTAHPLTSEAGGPAVIS